jgi:hypothetical protein
MTREEGSSAGQGIYPCVPAIFRLDCLGTVDHPNSKRVCPHYPIPPTPLHQNSINFARFEFRNDLIAESY